MNILLDTHYLLWSLFDSRRIPPKSFDYLLSDENQIQYSILSLWEISTKYQKWPVEFPFSPDLIADLCDDAGLKRLDLKPAHVITGSTLSLLEDAPRHKDPFDRMLIAQAKAEGSLLLTHDKKLAYYGEPCVAVV